MRYDVKLIRFVSTVCVVMFLLLEFSNGEVKPEDCTPKMEYWSPGSSESLFDNPHCVPCPPNWANCKDQPIHERKSCYDSCGKSHISYQVSISCIGALASLTKLKDCTCQHIFSQTS